MKLTIDLDQEEPPVGRVDFQDEAERAIRVEVAFAGWLGLLAALSDLLAERSPP